MMNLKHLKNIVKNYLIHNNMKGLYKWLGSMAALIGFMLFDGFVYMCAYELGFEPFASSFGIDLPNINYGAFVLFAGMMHIFKGKDGETYEITDYRVWGEIISNYLSKLFIIGILFMMNLIIIG